MINTKGQVTQSILFPRLYGHIRDNEKDYGPLTTQELANRISQILVIANAKGCQRKRLDIPRITIHWLLSSATKRQIEQIVKIGYGKDSRLITKIICQCWDIA